MGRARKHWHVLRAEVQAQLQQWTNSNQDLPDLAVLWDVIVSDQDGVELKTVPAKCKRCAKAISSTSSTSVAVDQAGKENTQTEAVKVLTHKLAAFSSIINRRRSFAREHQVSACPLDDQSRCWLRLPYGTCNSYWIVYLRPLRRAQWRSWQRATDSLACTRHSHGDGVHSCCACYLRLSFCLTYYALLGLQAS